MGGAGMRRVMPEGGRNRSVQGQEQAREKGVG